MPVIAFNYDSPITVACIPQNPSPQAPTVDNRVDPYPCAPTARELTQNPVVRTALNQAWADSGYGTRNAHEEGGWIFADNQNNAITIVRAAPGTDSDMSSMATNLTPIGIGSRLIGWFHTHPFREGAPIPSQPGYIYGDQRQPSQDDRDVSRDLQVPGLIRNRRGVSVVGPNRRPCFGSG